MKVMVTINGLVGDRYVEPYAGGAAVALSLLYEEYVRCIHINDLNRGIHAFWWAVLNRNDDLCRRVSDARLTIDEWHRQREVQVATDPDMLDLAFSTFFLNRTNRSGIVWGGPIGGRDQAGAWGLEARFNKRDLTKRIEKIGRFAGRIILTNDDAYDFLVAAEEAGVRGLVYLDPPYRKKGADLYENHYTLDDHSRIAELMSKASYHWVVSYDDHKEITDLYSEFRCLRYGINYSAQGRYRGSEAMFFSRSLVIPPVDDPVCLPRKQLLRLTAGEVGR